MRAQTSLHPWLNATAAAALALTAVCGAALSLASPAFGQSVSVERSDEARHAGEFTVPVNKSQVLRVDVPFSDVLIGNEEIADVVPLTDRSVYVLGRSMGSTSLTLYDGNRNLIAVMDLVVTVDVEGLKARLHDLMPNEPVEVRGVNGAVVLSGQLSSASAVKRALDVAERYAPDQVTNLMQASGSQQVMLQVRFAEVSRQVVRELGLNSAVFGRDFSLVTGDVFAGAGVLSSAFAVAEGVFSTGSATFAVVFDALERKGLVKTLAEPNLIALSGDTASFLAGGEFPVPVAQSRDEGDSTITVEFKEFGVGLGFTPTVLDDGLINIAVTPEVSRIDPANAVVVQGFEIPGLTVRRATTTVELRDGQSFAIAGLIQSNFEDTVRQFPVLSEVPVLSALFRSTDFQQSETELVIIVTPQLVRPADPRNLATPVDTFMPPSMPELWLLGRTEGQSRHGGMSAADAGGVSGSHGHIIE